MSNIYDELNDEQLRPRVYFGQVFVDAFYVYVSKGEPKVLFDPAQHPAEKRFKQVKIDAQCTDSTGKLYTISREVIVEFGREWAGFILPSLKACNCHPGELNEKWAKFERVKTGRTYHSDYTGKDEDEKTFKFLEIYPDEAACREAEKAHYSRPTPEVEEEDASATHPMPDDTQASNNAQRGVAEKFLPALWKSAAGDVTRFGELIAGNPLTSKFFDINSPEVAAIVAGGTA